MKIQNVKMIDVHDFDKLVRETYGRDYCFQQQDGCKERQIVDIEVPEYEEDYENDTIPEVVNGDEMGVSFKAWLERDPKKPIPGQEADYELNLFWERNFYPHYSMVINDLHKKGLIDKGKYKINIDW